MPITKKKSRTTKKKKSKTSRVSQVGCATRQKGGAVGTMFSETPIIYSRTVYPLSTTGGLNNPVDARQTGGKKRNKHYSRKYYKQSGGSSVMNYSPAPVDYSKQPINTMYSDSNRFLV